ncbi:hypothetical protein H4R26_002507 [Coemansia thaxteri]|uniref:Uncharacterized protein n=1 Tax=Coemansia thaxteri TaxID=2663907 RepID=A0A9W8BEQ8_9FUNG|nr:hypothetical protein H4R26_002507 [Coemansia thaxteri]KAJ2484800.1 hypothetical protein EV174_002165 [Coemansia sp. RSA 2320]
MFGYSISALALTAVLAAASVNAHAVPVKRCGVCGGLYGGYGGLYGGYGGFGFPFASSFTSDFDRNTNRANFNDDTLYANNVNANAANDNVHAFTNANVVA